MTASTTGRGWRAAGLVHDTSLALWTVLALRRATGYSRSRALEVGVIAANLAGGTPFALRRVRQRRRDVVALVSPVAVLVALLSTVRGGWSPVAATVVLHLLLRAERRREATTPGGPGWLSRR